MPILSEYQRRTRPRLIAPHTGGDILDIGCGRAAVLQISRFSAQERNPAIPS